MVLGRVMGCIGIKREEGYGCWHCLGRDDTVSIDGRDGLREGGRRDGIKI